MMRKHTAQQMRKVSLWMPVDEYNKIVEESEDLSLNLYMMRLVRKARAEKRVAEEGQGGGKVQR